MAFLPREFRWWSTVYHYFLPGRRTLVSGLVFSARMKTGNRRRPPLPGLSRPPSRCDSLQRAPTVVGPQAPVLRDARSTPRIVLVDITKITNGHRRDIHFGDSRGFPLPFADATIIFRSHHQRTQTVRRAKRWRIVFEFLWGMVKKLL